MCVIDRAVMKDEYASGEIIREVIASIRFLNMSDTKTAGDDECGCCDFSGILIIGVKTWSSFNSPQ